MKKIIKYSLLILGIILLTGCVNKKSITNKEFNDFFKEKDFEVYEATDQLTQKNNIKEVYIAINDNYQIELYILNSIENAKEFYKEDVRYFKQEIIQNDKNHNYESYLKEEDDTFVYISRIDETVTYVSSKIEYKDEIINLLKEINY